MSQKKSGILLLCAALLFTQAHASGKTIRGTGPAVTETRAATSFNTIDLHVAADVYITEGTDYSIRVEAQKELLPVLITEVQGPALKIKYPSGISLSSTEPVKIFVTVPSIHRLEVFGSGNIYAAVALHTDELDLQVNGSGTIQLAGIAASEVSAIINGSGNIALKQGDTHTESIKINGSGNMDCSGIRAAIATTQIAGSGNIKLRADELLNVSISGSGNVYYLGTPKINTHIAGSGQVQAL